MTGITLRQVEHVEAGARVYGLAYFSEPPLWLVTRVAGEYSDICRAARGHGSAEGVRRLHQVRGRLAGLMAMLFGEAERHTQVDGWLAAADEAAGIAGDPALGCWLGALAAGAACDRGHYAEALEIAEEVIDTAPAGAAGMVLAEAVRTVAWAERGQSSAALASLARADEAYGTLPEDQTGSGGLGYPPAMRHHHRGHALAALAMPVLARTALTAALDRYAPDALRVRAEVELDLAHCDSYEDGWLAVWPRAKAIVNRVPAEHRTVRLARRLQELPERMKRR